MPLKRTEKDDTLFRYLDIIQYAPLKEFTEEALMTYGTKKHLLVANKVIDVMMEMMKKKNLLSSNTSQAFVEIMLSSALLHNLFYNGSLHSVFFARERLTPLAREKGVPEMSVMQIFQLIEAQFGDDIAIEACRPRPSHPTELFAWAVWFVEEYNSTGKKMPC